MITKEAVNEERRIYIEKILRAALEPADNFLDIEYLKTNLEAEYIRIISLIGTVAYIDITAFSEEKILSDVTDLALGKCVPKSLITDTNDLRKIAPLFIRKKATSA